MIPNIGPLEIAIVVIIALVVFGPKRLPELGRSLGSGITEFKDGLSNPKGSKDEKPEPAQLSGPPDPDPDPSNGEAMTGQSTGGGSQPGA